MHKLWPKAERMDWMDKAWVSKRIRRKHCAGWIGTTRLVTPRIGTVDKRLICKIKLRGPVCNEAASEFVPVLIDRSSGRITVASEKELARNPGEVFAILCPA